MSLVEELKSVLPTRVARWTVVLTGVLLPLSSQAPVFLKPLLWPKVLEKDLVLYQILAIIAALSIGAFIIALSMWHYYAFSKGRQKRRFAEQYLQALKNRGSRNP